MIRKKHSKKTPIKKLLCTHKKAVDVFSPLEATEYRLRTAPIKTMIMGLNSGYQKLFLEKSINKILKPFAHFLQTFQKCTNYQDFEKKMNIVYELLDSNIDKFITYLVSKNFAAKKLETLDRKEVDDKIEHVIKRYLTLVGLFFLQNESLKIKPPYRTEEYLLTLANRFFDYGLRGESNETFVDMLNDRDYHPIMRLMYSVMNQYFVVDGWKFWNIACLDNLKTQADAGKNICYIAGGFDIYHLLNHGIYNITVIDPFLPSQDRFYITDWEWLICNKKSKNGGLGDRITFGKKKIELVRMSYEKKASFSAKTSSGKTVEIIGSITVWQVIGISSKKILGTVVLDRRFCNTSDFKPDVGTALLMSFNEFYFVTAYKKNGGWGMDHKKLSKNLQIFIKQLDISVTKNVVMNMRKTEQSLFDFCTLGSDIN